MRFLLALGLILQFLILLLQHLDLGLELLNECTVLGLAEGLPLLLLLMDWLFRLGSILLVVHHRRWAQAVVL